MSGRRTPTAVLFDVDGTLVDSNYLHVDAWQRAFDAVGARVPAWRIHRAIGLDSERLLETLLGDDAAELGGAASDRHAEYYAELAPRLRRLPKARRLIVALHDAGVRVVLATSAPDDELRILRRVVDAEACVYAETSSADVDVAKPEPDVVAVALERAGVAPENAVLIGDSRWDMEAATRAGVRAIGVRSGGVADAELIESGAVAVYGGCAEILAELDRGPLAPLLADAPG